MHPHTRAREHTRTVTRASRPHSSALPALEMKQNTEAPVCIKARKAACGPWPQAFFSTHPAGQAGSAALPVDIPLPGPFESPTLIGVAT